LNDRPRQNWLAFYFALLLGGVNNSNDKNIGKILNINKSSMTKMIYITILLALLKLYTFSYLESLEKLRTLVVIAILLLVLCKVKNSLTIQEFDYYFMLIFFSFIGSVLVSYLTLIVTFSTDNILKNVKPFYRLSSLTLLLLTGRFNIENKWLTVIYK